MMKNGDIKGVQRLANEGFETLMGHLKKCPSWKSPWRVIDTHNNGSCDMKKRRPDFIFAINGVVSLRINHVGYVEIKAGVAPDFASDHLGMSHHSTAILYIF